MFLRSFLFFCGEENNFDFEKVAKMTSMCVRLNVTGGGRSDVDVCLIVIEAPYE